MPLGRAPVARTVALLEEHVEAVGLVALLGG